MLTLRTGALLTGLTAAVLTGPAHAQVTDFFVLLSDGNASDGQILRINAAGQVEGVFAPNVPSPRGTAISPTGQFFVSVTGAGSPFVAGFNLDGTQFTSIGSAQIGGGPLAPFDLEVNAAGDLFISNNAQNQILRVDSGTGDISVFANVQGTRGLGFAPDGRLFVSQAGGSLSVVGTDGTVTQFAGNANGVIDPFDVQVDSRGNVFVVNQLVADGIFNDGEVLSFAPGFDLTTGALGRVASNADVRGLAINPFDAVFASTAAGTIVEITNNDAIFASGLNDPFAFDFVPVPGPGGSTAALVLTALLASRRRR
jgi:hypothetical protein